MSAATSTLRPAPEPATAPRVAPRAIELRSWADIGVIVVLTLIGLVGLATAFTDAGYLLAGVGGLLVGTAVALATARYRVGILVTVAIAVGAYFLLGSALAMPAEATLVVLPNLQTLSGLAIGVAYGWADLVTLRAPVSLPYYVTAVPYVLGWLVSLVSVTLAVRWLPMRRRTVWRSALLLIGPSIVYLLGVLLGTDEPYYAAARGIAFAGIALVWLGWRRRSGARIGLGPGGILLRRKLLGTVVVVAVAAVAGGVAGTLLAPPPDNRFVLREEVQPPFEPLDYPGPLAGFRKYTKDLVDTELFTVSGLEAGQQLRLATMDTYDGVLWGVAGAQTPSSGSGDFRLVGKRFPEPPLLTSAADSRISVSVSGYDDVWLPEVGYPTDLVLDGSAELADLRYNAATGSAVLTTGVRDGVAYRLDAELQSVPKPDELADVPTASIAMPAVENIPDPVSARASEVVAEAETPIAQVVAIEQHLTTEGYLSHGTASDQVPSRAGHGSDRMSQMIDNTTMVGDEEQYSSLMALMLRSIDIPARVVMGFAPEIPEGSTGPITVTGENVTAWVEVPFEGVGWVPFYPTPDDTDVPQDQKPKPRTEPQPQVRQPPRTDNEEDDLVSAVEIDDSDEDDENLFDLPGWVIALALGILIPAALLGVPLLVVAAIKARRAARRRRPGGDLAVAGAWDELVDRLSELGYDSPPRSTRVMAARSLDTQLLRTDQLLGAGQLLRAGQPDPARAEAGPTAPVPPRSAPAPAEPGSVPPVTTLARRTDAAVFGGEEVPAERVRSAWDDADRAVYEAAARSGRWRRILSRYRVGAARRWASRVATTATEAAGVVRPGRDSGAR